MHFPFIFYYFFFCVCEGSVGLEPILRAVLKYKRKWDGKGKSSVYFEVLLLSHILYVCLWGIFLSLLPCAWKVNPLLFFFRYTSLLFQLFSKVFSSPAFPTQLQRIVRDGLAWEVKKNAYTSFFKIVYSYVGFAFVYFSVTDFNPTNSHVSRLASRRHLLLHCQICLFYLSGRSSAEPGWERVILPRWRKGHKERRIFCGETNGCAEENSYGRKATKRKDKCLNVILF